MTSMRKLALAAAAAITPLLHSAAEPKRGNQHVPVRLVAVGAS
jgi:hypothetical protein